MTCSPAGLLPSDLKGKGWARTGRWGCRWSVDGQDAHATGAAAGAAEVTGIASGGLHRDVETSGSGDHRGANGDRELRTIFHGGGESGAVEDHHGRGNELAAGHGEYETGGNCERTMVVGEIELRIGTGRALPQRGFRALHPGSSKSTISSELRRPIQ